MPNEEETEIEEPIEETTEEESSTTSEENELPTSVEELQQLVASLQANLQKVTKESIKRKGQIKALRTEIDDLKTNVPDAENIAKENKTLKAQLQERDSELRGYKLSDKVASAVSAAKKLAFVDETAKADFIKRVTASIDPEWDDEDIATELPNLITAESKARPYMLAQKKPAPDIDQHSNGTSTKVPENEVEEVVRDFGLNNPVD